MYGKAFLAVSAALGLALGAGCDRPGPFAASSAPASADAPDPGYHAPPELTGVAAGAGGTVSLTGHALPSSKVLMVSPAGARIETTADGQGQWIAPLGPVSEPTLYRLAAEAKNGERVEAEGLVAVLPGTVALLRAGAGAEVQAPSKPDLAILAVDFDSGGAAVVSGRAPPGPVRILVDGAAAIDGAAGTNGRFSLTLPKPLSPGLRRLEAATPKGDFQAQVAITPPAPPSDGPYRASSVLSGWRLDWVTAGGGPQTTLLLGPPAAG